MLARIEKSSTGTLEYRVPGRLPVIEATCALFDSAGAALGAAKDLAVPFAADISSVAQSGNYSVLALDIDEAGSELSASLRGRRIRLAMDKGPDLEPIVEAVDLENETISVDLPRSVGTPLVAIDPVLVCPVTALESATIGEAYEARWTWELSDETTGTGTNYWSVVLRAVPSLTLADVLDRNDSFRALLGTVGESSWRSWLEAAREEVDVLMAQHGRRTECVAEREQLMPLLIQAIRVVCARDGVVPRGAILSEYLADARKELSYKARQVLQNAYLVNGSTISSGLPRSQHSRWNTR